MLQKLKNKKKVKELSGYRRRWESMKDWASGGHHRALVYGGDHTTVCEDMVVQEKGLTPGEDKRSWASCLDAMAGAGYRPSLTVYL